MGIFPCLAAKYASAQEAACWNISQHLCANQCKHRSVYLTKVCCWKLAVPLTDWVSLVMIHRPKCKSHKKYLCFARGTARLSGDRSGRMWRAVRGDASALRSSELRLTSYWERERARDYKQCRGFINCHNCCPTGNKWGEKTDREPGKYDNNMIQSRESATQAGGLRNQPSTDLQTVWRTVNKEINKVCNVAEWVTACGRAAIADDKTAWGTKITPALPRIVRQAGIIRVFRKPTPQLTSQLSPRKFQFVSRHRISN